jgi:glutamate racemase
MESELMCFGLTFYNLQAFVNDMIGIYDSGVGGLSIAELVTNSYQGLDVIYYGDTEMLPLGEKTASQIIEAVDRACRYLHKRGCKLIILACNTASAVALRYLQNQYQSEGLDIKVIGIVIPIIEVIHNRMLVGQFDGIALVATPATIQSGYYQEKLRENGYQNILEIPAQGLAKAIEISSNKEITTTLYEIKAQLAKLQNPLIILACTHYIYIQDQLFQICNQGSHNNFSILHQLEGFIEKFAGYCSRKEISLDQNGSLQLLVTGDPVVFTTSINKLLVGSVWSMLKPHKINP